MAETNVQKDTPKANIGEKNPDEVVISLDRGEDEKLKLMPGKHTSLESTVPTLIVGSEIFSGFQPADGTAFVSSGATFWQLEFYKKYFNISTVTAIDRCLKAMWPFRDELFLESERDLDLYVPLWNFVTLIVTMGVLSNAVKSTDAGDSSAGFACVVRCFTALGLYLGTNSGVAYLVLRFYGATVGCLDIVALYGYSLVSFVPMSFLYLLPFRMFRAAVVLASSGVSLYFLERNLGKACDKHLGTSRVFAQVYAVVAMLILVYVICFHIYP